MSHNNSESRAQQTINSDDDYDDEDDFVTFQYESRTINLYYSHFSKYSRRIRNEYLFPDIKKRLPQELHNFQQQHGINSENIILFFQLLQEDFNINQNLTYTQYIDLYKISEFLQIKKFTKKLIQYFNGHDADTDFQIQIILHETASNDNANDSQLKLNTQVEDLLTTKIDECLQNEKFSKLPPSLVHRIVQKSAKKKLNSNILYDFIKKDANSFFPLFSFVDVGSLSDGRFDDLYGSFTNKNGDFKQFFGYLPCSLSCIKKLKDENKSLHLQIDGLEQEKSRMMANLSEIESEKSRMQKAMSEIESEKSRIEQENSQLRKKLSDSVDEKSRIEQEKNQLQQRLADVENEFYKVDGKIVARVKNGIFLDADIILAEKGAKLDKSSSRYILSSSSAESIGKEAYKSGELVTSLNHKTLDFACKPGTYFVRAFVVSSNGKSVEIVSNPVEVNDCLSFGYTGDVTNLMLPRGRYRLEVWGAKGGDSTSGSSSRGNGGLGGYSVGTLSLQNDTKIFVYVGGQGRPGGKSDGEEAAGSFPDGGGTKTGHYGSHTSVPGTGGGSTSIRLMSDSLYTRVIVAGGGGGAGGDQGCRDKRYRCRWCPWQIWAWSNRPLQKQL